MNRILIIGCGDMAMRVARLLLGRYQVFGLVRKVSRFAELRAAGITPLLADLDQPRSLQRLCGLAHTVLHFAPPTGATPPASGVNSSPLTDSRTRNLLATLSRGSLPQRLIYISTSGVYGDCKGEIVTETRPVRAHSARAQLRIDAEIRIRRWAGRNGIAASILRVPGIYAAERLPLERLRKATPAVVEDEDGYTNHIHADDLARCVVAALRHGKANRVYHTVDGSRMKMGEYFDAVADAFELPHPPRISRAEAQLILSPMLLSFMNESRRLTNARMTQELKVVLRYPTVAAALQEFKPRGLSLSTAPACASPHQM